MTKKDLEKDIDIALKLLYGKVLTVTASGDHAIAAIAAGAKEVDCIDINRLAKYYASLKIATLLAHPKRKFIKSFNCSPKYLEPVIKNNFKLHHVSPFLL